MNVKQLSDLKMTTGPQNDLLKQATYSATGMDDIENGHADAADFERINNQFEKTKTKKRVTYAASTFKDGSAEKGPLFAEEGIGQENVNIEMMIEHNTNKMRSSTTKNDMPTLN